MAEVEELVGLGTHFEDRDDKIWVGCECHEGKWNQRQFIPGILAVGKHSWLHFSLFHLKCYTLWEISLKSIEHSAASRDS